MEIAERIKKLIEVFRVANDDVIGTVAAERYELNWKKEGLSRRNNAHKYLDELALTNQIKKGKSFYSVKEYQGEYKLGGHDRKITEAIAQLICLKLPVTIHREISFPIGIRSDLVVLLGKGNKAICAVIEVVNHETPEYLHQKIIAWKNWTEAPQYLSKLFNTPIPHFSIITEGITHPLAVEFKKFIEEVSYDK